MSLPLTLTILVLLSVAACASSEKSSEDGASAKATENSQEVDFNQGLRALDSEEYEQALRIFNRLLLQKPGTELDLVTLYNTGAAYQGLGNCHKAAERYRQVVRSSENKFVHLEGEALFHLSLMYECLGQDTKAVAALLDAQKRAKDLPYETINAEIPARLAAAYARLGNRERAMEYFGRAGAGLKSLIARGTGTKAQVETVARTLFLMGQLSPSQRTAKTNATTYLQSISMQQPYLLQAIEINDPHWSAKAENDLRLAYENMWKFEFPDTSARRDFYLRCVQVVNELRRIRMPQPDPRESALFVAVDDTDRRLRTELSKVDATTRLTPEAERRQGLKQQGRLINPEN